MVAFRAGCIHKLSLNKLHPVQMNRVVWVLRTNRSEDERRFIETIECVMTKCVIIILINKLLS